MFACAPQFPILLFDTAILVAGRPEIVHDANGVLESATNTTLIPAHHLEEQTVSVLIQIVHVSRVDVTGYFKRG